MQPEGNTRGNTSGKVFPVHQPEPGRETGIRPNPGRLPELSWFDQLMADKAWLGVLVGLMIFAGVLLWSMTIGSIAGHEGGWALVWQSLKETFSF